MNAETNTQRDELAQTLKTAEAKHSSLERSLLFHREVAEDLVAVGYRKPRILGYVVTQNGHLLNGGQFTTRREAQDRADWLNDGQPVGSPIIYGVAEIVEAAE